MTLRQLIEELQRLPLSALEATVNAEYTEGGDMGSTVELSSDIVRHVEYEGGVVRIITESADGFDPTDEEND